MTYDLSVIAPCYNEEGNLRVLVDRLQSTFSANSIAGEIVLVNDGSRDGTGPLADKLAGEHSNLVVVHHASNQGILGGWRSGLDASHGNLVCLIDADLQNPPEDVARLFREIRSIGKDVVQAARVPVHRDSRYLLSRTLNLILNTCFDMRLRDNKSGFIICPPAVLADILKHRMHYYYFQSLIMISAHAKGYSIGEIETQFQSRHAGESFISSFPALFVCKVLIDVLKALYEYRLSPETSAIQSRSA